MTARRATRQGRGTPGMTLAAVVLAGCSSSPSPQAGPVPGTEIVHGDTVPTVARLGPTSFTGTGPLGVGETTLTLPTDGAPVEVWYPATKASVAGKPEATYDLANWLPAALKKLIPAGFTVTYPSGGVRGVPVAPGRYPRVVFSHGYAGFRNQSTFLTARLASWGFVVAAPDHFSRDLTEVLGGPTAATAKTTDVGDLKATITFMGGAGRVSVKPVPRPRGLRPRGCRGPLRRRRSRRGAGRHRPKGDHVHRIGRGDGRLLRSDQERSGQRRTAPAGDADVRDIGPRGQ
jgi:hypothetical protein